MCLGVFINVFISLILPLIYSKNGLEFWYSSTLFVEINVPIFFASLLILGSLIGEINDETYEIDFILSKKATKKQLLFSKILSTIILNIISAIVVSLSLVIVIIYFLITDQQIIVLNNNISFYIGLIISGLVICIGAGVISTSFGYWAKTGIVTIASLFVLGCYILIFQLIFPLDTQGIPNWTNIMYFASIAINIVFPPLSLLAILGGTIAMERKL